MNKIREHILKGEWKTSIPLLMVSAFLYTIAVSIFLYNADAYPTGAGAYAQLIVFMSDINPGYFSYILLAFNIPFLIIFWKKCGRKFMIYTLLWVVFQLTLSEILFSFSIFSDSNPFSFELMIKSTEHTFYPAGRFVYAIAGTVIAGFSIGLAYLAGGSTAGTDILVYYLCQKHKKSIGLFETIIGIITTFSSIFIRYIYIKITNHQTDTNTIFKLIFGLTTFITIIYISVTSFIMYLIYPRHRKVELNISSKKIDEIYIYLMNSEFRHAFGIRKERSLYSKRENEVIKTVVLYLEVSMLVANIKKIDEHAWITATFVRQISGNFDDAL